MATKNKRGSSATIKDAGLSAIEKEFSEEIDTSIQKHNSRKKAINSKRKGNAAEREVCKILNERFTEKGLLFRRNVSSGAIVGGFNAKNVKLYTDEQLQMLASDVSCNNPNFVFSIEHKFYAEMDFYELFNESSKLNSWLEQCTTDAKKVNKEPLLVVKTNNHKRICFVRKEWANQFTDLTPHFDFYYDKVAFSVYWFEEFLTNTKDESFLNE